MCERVFKCCSICQKSNRLETCLFLFSVLCQEPVSLYGDTKFFSLAKLDRSLNLASIKKFVEEEEAK